MSEHYKKIGESLDDLISSNDKLRNKYQNYQLTEIWSQVAGVLIAKYTTKMYINNKTLFLYVSSAPLKQEIQFAKDNLISKVNQHLPYEKIEDLVIR